MGSEKRRRTLNPADAFRRQERQREKKRNRLERQRIREETTSKTDPSKIRDQLDKLKRLRSQGQLEHKGAQQLQHLQRVWDQLVADGKTVNMPPPNRNRHRETGVQASSFNSRFRSATHLNNSDNDDDSGDDDDNDDDASSGSEDETTDSESASSSSSRGKSDTRTRSSCSAAVKQQETVAQVARKAAMSRLGLITAGKTGQQLSETTQAEQRRWDVSQTPTRPLPELQVPSAEPDLDPVIASRLQALRQQHPSPLLPLRPRIMTLPESLPTALPPYAQGIRPLGGWIFPPPGLRVPPPPPPLLPPPPPSHVLEPILQSADRLAASVGDTSHIDGTVVAPPVRVDPHSAPYEPGSTFNTGPCRPASAQFTLGHPPYAPDTVYPPTSYAAPVMPTAPFSVVPAGLRSTDASANSASFEKKTAPLFVPTALRVKTKPKLTKQTNVPPAIRPGGGSRHTSLAASATSTNRGMINAPTSLAPAVTESGATDLDEAFRSFMDEVSKSLA